MAAVEQYEYLRLKDAVVCIGQKVSFYGVVRDYDQPKPTRGSDFVCTMTVEDMSYNKPGLRLIVFSSGVDNLPRVRFVGDIVRFHRVEIGVHNHSPQAVAKMKLGAAFVLFEGKQGVGHRPYQVSSRTYTFQDYDCQIIDLLRGWIADHPMGLDATDYLVPICGLKEGSYFDLCCKVLVVDKREPDHNLVLYVWDGTDAPPAYATLGNETEGREAQISETIQNHLPVLPREVLCAFPPIGSVLSVVPDVPVEQLPVKLPEPGNWVKFRNLTCRVRFGVYEAVFLRESKISLLLSNHGIVKERERLYQNRLSENGRLPQWSPKPLKSLTVTDYEHVPFSTLREIIVHPQVTFKFRCLAQVVAILPRNVMDFCALTEPENKHASEQEELKNENTEYVYRLRLTLEDPTARVHAFLYGKDAAKFFNGHSAAELQSGSATVGPLQRKVNKLLGIEEHGSHECTRSEGNCNPPWIKCCLKSYYLQKETPWESRRFRIFGTTLPG